LQQFCGEPFIFADLVQRGAFASPWRSSSAYARLMVPVVTCNSLASDRCGGSFSPAGSWPLRIACANARAMTWYLGSLPASILGSHAFIAMMRRSPSVRHCYAMGVISMIRIQSHHIACSHLL